MIIDIEFERECYKCEGSSRYWPDGRICLGCRNTGYVTTELGDHLIEFLEHYKVRESRKESSSTTTEREE